MTLSFVNRRSAVLAAAIVLGVATPIAEAKPIDTGPAGSGPASAQVAAPVAAMRLTTAHPAGGISDWGYVAIGSGVASLMLISAGGTHVVSRRRRKHDSVRPRVLS
jgi:hypothetical protein